MALTRGRVISLFSEFKYCALGTLRPRELLGQSKSEGHLLSLWGRPWAPSIAEGGVAVRW